MNRLKTAGLAAFVLMMSFSALAAPEISPSKKALIDELMRVSNAYSLGAGFLVDVLSISLPEKPTEARAAELREKIASDPQSKQMIDESFVNLYDSAFTEAELSQLIAFFKSDLGRKYAVLNLQLGSAGRGNLAGAASRELSESIERSKTKRTMSDLLSLSTACEAYFNDNNKYPIAAGLEELAAIISPVYILTPPKADKWGNPFVYAVTKDQQSYRFVSGGPDGRIETANRQFGSKEKKKNDDLILENAQFVQKPEWRK